MASNTPCCCILAEILGIRCYTSATNSLLTVQFSWGIFNKQHCISLLQYSDTYYLKPFVVHISTPSSRAAADVACEQAFGRAGNWGESSQATSDVSIAYDCSVAVVSSVAVWSSHLSTNRMGFCFFQSKCVVIVSSSCDFPTRGGL